MDTKTENGTIHTTLFPIDCHQLLPVTFDKIREAVTHRQIKINSEKIKQNHGFPCSNDSVSTMYVMWYRKGTGNTPKINTIKQLTKLDFFMYKYVQKLSLVIHNIYIERIDQQIRLNLIFGCDNPL